MPELTIEQMKQDEEISSRCAIEDRVQFLKDNGYEVTKENMLNVDLPCTKYAGSIDKEV